jgi:hypothetical protein
MRRSPQPEKPRRPGTFTKDDPRINRAGGPRGPRAAHERRGSKPSRLLHDMRLVYAQPERKDRTEGQKTLRKLFQESPKDFIAQLARLEEAHLRRGAKAAPLPDAGVLELDDGTAREYAPGEYAPGEVDELVEAIRVATR